MTGVVILFVILLVPIGLWMVLRWLPEQRRTRAPKAPHTGPRRRWWQP